jgi:RNA-directed DNA polymerase
MKHSWSSQQFIEGARSSGLSAEVIAASNAAARAVKTTHPDLPVILTLSHLAHLADVSPLRLRDIVKRRDDPYRVFRVKKRAHEGRSAAAPRRYRTICVPAPELMRLQRWIAQNILNITNPHPSSFAFAPGRDLVGAAERHAGCKWLVKMDVRHFFESISEEQVFGVFRRLGYGALISFEMARLCTRLHSRYYLNPQIGIISDSERNLPYPTRAQGHLPQGAPTSPMLANLVVIELDKTLDRLARSLGWIYTRYADDIAFSIRELSTRGRAVEISKLAERALGKFGLVANRQKTSITPPGGRKILLGVLIDRDQPKLTRAFRNNVETHLYALNSQKIGPKAHRERRGFASIIGMRRHVEGLIAFAHQIDRDYARELYASFDAVDWNG